MLCAAVVVCCLLFVVVVVCLMLVDCGLVFFWGRFVCLCWLLGV